MSNQYDEILGEIEIIFRNVFDDDELIVTSATHAADIDDWDSLAQITLVLSIEKAFKIKIAAPELEGLANVGDMVKLVIKKLS